MPKRIIIIDDEELIRSFLSSYLEQKGLEVESCQNAEELLEKIKQAEYDMVLTDNDMRSPIKGLEAIKIIRKDFGKNIPLYLMSGREISREALDEAGASGYLRKPFGLKDLDALVEGLQPTQQDSQPYTEQ